MTQDWGLPHDEASLGLGVYGGNAWDGLGGMPTVASATPDLVQPSVATPKVAIGGNQVLGAWGALVLLVIILYLFFTPINI